MAKEEKKKKKSKKPSLEKRLTKREIIEKIAEKMSTEKKRAIKYIESMNELIQEELKRCGQIMLPDFGKMILRDRPARMGRNPATGEAIKIKAKTVLKFRIAKAMKVAVLGEQPKRVTSKAKKTSSKDKKSKSKSKHHKSKH